MQGVKMKSFILIIICLFTLSSCVPLLVGGAVGYGISQHNERQQWIERERIRRENERWVWEMYHRGDINHREYKRAMQEMDHNTLPPVGLENPNKPY
jgi:hypothetical protein